MSCHYRSPPQIFENGGRIDAAFLEIGQTVTTIQISEAG